MFTKINARLLKAEAFRDRWLDRSPQRRVSRPPVLDFARRTGRRVTPGATGRNGLNGFAARLSASPWPTGL
jgi:hypothetical protein